MKRVDAHQDDVVVLVGQLNHLLLRTIGSGHTHQSGKASHAVVDMYDEIARLKLHQLFQRKGHLGIAGVIAL